MWICARLFRRSGAIFCNFLDEAREALVPDLAGPEAGGALPFPGANSIVSSRCGAISRLAAPLGAARTRRSPPAVGPWLQRRVMRTSRTLPGAQNRRKTAFHFLPCLASNRALSNGYQRQSGRNSFQALPPAGSASIDRSRRAVDETVSTEPDNSVVSFRRRLRTDIEHSQDPGKRLLLCGRRPSFLWIATPFRGPRGPGGGSPIRATAQDPWRTDIQLPSAPVMH